MMGQGCKTPRLRLWLTAVAVSLLAGCAVYPDEVADNYGGAYYGGGFYDYPGHYYSYYPGYYAYCPPVQVPRHYWSYWRQHRHWPDGWRREHAGDWRGGRGHADRPGRGGHGRHQDAKVAGAQQGRAGPAYVGGKGKPDTAQAGQGTGYRMPRLASNPAQLRGQFSRARAAARHESAVSRGMRQGGEGNWRGSDRRREGGMSKAERRDAGAAARSSGRGNSRSDGGARGSGSGSRGSGWSGGSDGGGGWSGGSRGGNSRGGGRGR
ncbi:hypothetical protein [Emcibacter sp. SYSU 3D8]|uniref:hypothetical protein n=1 Tax=Emcibacter sp. SYSU 3D8 TaxID=3133969 RepID=UPI0031FE8611